MNGLTSWVVVSVKPFPVPGCCLLNFEIVAFKLILTLAASVCFTRRLYRYFLSMDKVILSTDKVILPMDKVILSMDKI